MTDDRGLAALTELADRHWLETERPPNPRATCSCGGWQYDFDAPPPKMGDHFRPFSEHVALAILGDHGVFLPYGRDAELETATAMSYGEGLADGRAEAPAELERLREAVAHVADEAERWRERCPNARLGRWLIRDLLAALAPEEQS